MNYSNNMNKRKIKLRLLHIFTNLVKEKKITQNLLKIWMMKIKLISQLKDFVNIQNKTIGNKDNKNQQNLIKNSEID